MPVVLDTGELLKAPDKVLKETCEKLDIAYDSFTLDRGVGQKSKMECGLNIGIKMCTKAAVFKRKIKK